MKAYLRSARIAPKKANLIAKMVRGLPVSEAIAQLNRTNKKAARLIEKLLKSAVANAEHNDKQDPGSLVLKTIIVQQGTAYRRGVPMARGRIRPMQKFLSHIEIVLGVASREDAGGEKGKSQKKQKSEKSSRATSQSPKNDVQKKQSHSRSQKAPATKKPSSASSVSSDSSASS